MTKEKISIGIIGTGMISNITAQAIINTHGKSNGSLNKRRIYFLAL
ncbi:hypothetical protein [Flavobacterium sp. SORGH_AS_0622]|nr:hypothetical protein [Flavobacterium sp. SORGH_AS_0622]MDQ1165660.1 hypothetical protein [Flavobacterium sp. SORGH_AS_0622]